MTDKDGTPVPDVAVLVESSSKAAAVPAPRRWSSIGKGRVGNAPAKATVQLNFTPCRKRA